MIERLTEWFLGENDGQEASHMVDLERRVDLVVAQVDVMKARVEQAAQRVEEVQHPRESA